jgi:hypothetical protein
MVKFTYLTEAQQEIILQAPFRHYYLWRAVFKDGSQSTPVRIVVDPSATGLNLVLAKGVNMLTRIPEVLIQFRSHECGWALDISKMYNQLILNDSALPYSLFLYSEDLDEMSAPHLFVMRSAWYGVASTGNQANVAIDRLWEKHRDELPAAVVPLSAHRYMDDV